jgi:hypothetical protein
VARVAGPGVRPLSVAIDTSAVRDFPDAPRRGVDVDSGLKRFHAVVLSGLAKALDTERHGAPTAASDSMRPSSSRSTSPWAMPNTHARDPGRRQRGDQWCRPRPPPRRARTARAEGRPRHQALQVRVFNGKPAVCGNERRKPIRRTQCRLHRCPRFLPPDLHKPRLDGGVDHEPGRGIRVRAVDRHAGPRGRLGHDACAGCKVPGSVGNRSDVSGTPPAAASSALPDRTERPQR